MYLLMVASTPTQSHSCSPTPYFLATSSVARSIAIVNLAFTRKTLIPLSRLTHLGRTLRDEATPVLLRPYKCNACTLNDSNQYVSISPDPSLAPLQGHLA